MVDTGEAQALTMGLVRIESVNPTLSPGGSGELAVARFIREWLRSHGLDADLVEAAPGRPNVVCAIRGSGRGQTLLLNGHTDTVGIEGMQIDPLGAEVRDGRLYGRGACDMKGGLAAMMIAMREIARGPRLPGDVIMTAVVDEEYASAGTEQVARDFAHKADGAIVVEPTGLEVHIAHKGFAWATIETRGRAAHGSRPAEGVDAIAHMGRVLVEIERLGARLASRRHPLLGAPSIHASLISGGTELSTYPPSCTLKVERRTIPGEFPEVVQAELDSILEALEKEDASFNGSAEVFFWRPPLETDPDHPVVTSLVGAMEALTGSRPAFGGSSGWLDSALLDAAGIPSVVFGPGGGGMHGAAEWVDLAQVRAAADVLVETARRFCSETRGPEKVNTQA
ncbi:MAG: ArgE/DapE family deacylase [Firmicutes bacterium]|nr:ArgE/DapE family deacylase [Bacillota bacterium]